MLRLLDVASSKGHRRTKRIRTPSQHSISAHDDDDDGVRTGTGKQSRIRGMEPISRGPGVGKGKAEEYLSPEHSALVNTFLSPVPTTVSMVSVVIDPTLDALETWRVQREAQFFSTKYQEGNGGGVDGDEGAEIGEMVEQMDEGPGEDFPDPGGSPRGRRRQRPFEPAPIRHSWQLPSLRARCAPARARVPGKAGDDTLRLLDKILGDLEGLMGMVRSEEQRYAHYLMKLTVLHKIYGDDWEQVGPRKLVELGAKEDYVELLGMWPRRFGKTVACQMFAAAYLLAIPTTKIAVCSPGLNQSQMLSSGVAFMILTYVAKMGDACPFLVEVNRKRCLMLRNRDPEKQQDTRTLLTETGEADVWRGGEGEVVVSLLFSVCSVGCFISFILFILFICLFVCMYVCVRPLGSSRVAYVYMAILTSVSAWHCHSQGEHPSHENVFSPPPWGCRP